MYVLREQTVAVVHGMAVVVARVEEWKGNGASNCVFLFIIEFISKPYSKLFSKDFWLCVHQLPSFIKENRSC